MRHDQYAPQLQLAPVTGETHINAGRRWFNQVVMQCSRPLWRSRPAWVRVPERVWHRQSALLVGLYERTRQH